MRSVILRAGEDRDGEAFNESIPQIAYCVCLELRFPLGTRGEIRPEPLVDEYRISAVGDDEVMLPIAVDITEVVGQQVVFSRGPEKSTALNKALLPGQISNKVRDRIQGAHDNLQRGIIEDMDIAFGRIDLPDGKRPTAICSSVRVHGADHLRGDHEAAGSSEDLPAPLGDPVSDQDTVKCGACGIRKRDWEALRAGGVEKEPPWVGPDPALGTPDLLRRFLHGALEPASPVHLFVVSSWVSTVLVGKDENMILEDHQEVCDLLAFPGRTGEPLVTVRPRIAPE